MGQVNRALGRLSGARLDLWESRYLANEVNLRRSAKRDATRARRRLDRAVVRAELAAFVAR